jgi:hypothetical protein
MHTSEMDHAPLTAEEMAALPPIRPRWVAEIAGLVGACVATAVAFLVVKAVNYLDPIVAGWGLPVIVAIPLLIATLAAPWVLLSPLLFRVGFDWDKVVLLAVFLFAAPILGWRVGFRLARIPYRDWRPSGPQRPSVRPMPGTGFHVLQADLDRWLPARDLPSVDQVAGPRGHGSTQTADSHPDSRSEF